MVLHCVVVAFLALGAAILTAHDRALFGATALMGEKKEEIEIKWSLMINWRLDIKERRCIK
jgi:hypothetical protein